MPVSSVACLSWGSDIRESITLFSDNSLMYSKSNASYETYATLSVYHCIPEDFAWLAETDEKNRFDEMIGLVSAVAKRNAPD